MMIPKTLSALVAATLLTMPVEAVAQSGSFRGGGTVSGWTNACMSYGWGPGPEAYSVRFHPANVGGNGDRDHISFLALHHAMSYSIEGGTFGTSWTAVDH